VVAGIALFQAWEVLHACNHRILDCGQEVEAAAWDNPESLEEKEAFGSLEEADSHSERREGEDVPFPYLHAVAYYSCGKVEEGSRAECDRSMETRTGVA